MQPPNMVRKAGYIKPEREIAHHNRHHFLLTILRGGSKTRSYPYIHLEERELLLRAKEEKPNKRKVEETQCNRTLSRYVRRVVLEVSCRAAKS